MKTLHVDPRSFLLYDLAVRSEVEFGVLDLMSDAGFDTNLAYEVACAEVDDLEPQFLLHLDTRTEEGLCSYCLSEAQDTEHPVANGMCSVLVHDWLVARLVTARIKSMLILPKISDSHPGHLLQAANVVAFAQSCGDWIAAVVHLERILEELPPQSKEQRYEEIMRRMPPEIAEQFRAIAEANEEDEEDEG